MLFNARKHYKEIGKWLNDASHNQKAGLYFAKRISIAFPQFPQCCESSGHVTSPQRYGGIL